MLWLGKTLSIEEREVSWHLRCFGGTKPHYSCFERKMPSFLLAAVVEGILKNNFLVLSFVYCGLELIFIFLLQQSYQYPLLPMYIHIVWYR